MPIETLLKKRATAPLPLYRATKQTFEMTELEAGQSVVVLEEPEIRDHTMAETDIPPPLEPLQSVDAYRSTPTKLYEKCKQQALLYVLSYYFIELILCLGFY